MSKFTYKTRGGSKPQGKPNVYMACHPEDQSLFLEKYSDQILDIHNCAIWYETEYDAPYDQDELVFNLEQMQLIVILITGKLLTTPNRVMNLEFSIALERHIPVLPIMLEQGIDGIYTEKFGGLHYLDPNDLDPTKREFREVLESYLKSVLIGDEMAERVRAAFDAYIFLSYRKKDRAKAQKLMRLIHKKPLCYDIAIWYDEFLVPGEDFDHLIHEMINNSDVFLMAVTPNLINEENYISRTEYPAAKESNKKIIPVEMEETDRQELKAKYSGIPDCISNENEEGIAEEILLALHKTALSQSDADPEHSFLIGLAYLDGISVEVDFNRAVQMIRKAGDAEVPEAIKQLISMYETGKGVPIDYNEGIKWRKRYTKYLQKQCSVNQDAEIVLDYLYALLNLGDALNNLRRLDEAENVYRAILTELNNHTLDSLEFQKISGHAYGRLGNSTFMQGKYEESEEYCKKALEIDKELVNILDTDLSYYNLSVGYEHLGRISISKGEFKEADHYYIRCHELRKDLVEKTGDARFRYGLIASYDHLGNIAERQHRYQEAQRYYEQGLEIAIALSEEMGTASSYSALAESYKNVGNALLMQGKTETAKKYLNKSLYVIRILAENLKTVDLRETLASVYLSLGDIEKTGFHLKEAYEYYKSSIEILLALVKETGTNQVYRNLGRIYKRLGDISSAEKNLKEAKEYYMKGADLFLRLVQETGSFESCSDLASAYNSLGIVADSQYNYDEAKEYYKLCIGLQITMAKKTGAPDELIALAYSYNNMGNLLKNQGLLEDAQRHIEKAIEICEMLIAKGGGLEEFNALQGMYLNLGGCLIRDPSQFELAKDTFQKIIDIEKKTNYPQLKQLANIEKNILHEYSTPQKLYKIGDYEYGQGNYINAILWIKEALKTDPNENKEETFSFLRCYYMLGQMYLKCGDKKAALYWLNKIASSDEFAGKMSQPVLHDERFSNIETVSGRVIAEQGGTDFITAFDFHEERNSFAVGYKSGKLIVFDFEHPGKVLYECTESASITRICIDSKYKRYYVTTKDHSIILYDSSFSIIRKFVGKDFILCEPHSLATYYDTAITCYEIGQLTERGSFDLADLAAKTGIDFLKIEEINGNRSSPVILINVCASTKKGAKMAWTRYLIVYDLSNNAVTGIIASEEPLEITTQYSINIQSRNIKKGIISSDGKQITALTDDNRVVIYSKTDGSWYKSDEFAFKDNGERIPIHGLHYSERPNVLYLQIKNRLVQFDLKEKAIVSQV